MKNRIENLDSLIYQAKQEILKCDNFEEIKQVKAKILKNKDLVETNKLLRQMTIEQKKLIGEKLGFLYKTIDESIVKANQKIIDNQISKKLNSNVDLSYNPYDQAHGTFHPIEQLKTMVVNFFSSQGYLFHDGKEVEEEYYNFTCLNLPKNHPAREMQDTLYTEDKRLLVTHTTNVTGYLLHKLKSDEIKAYTFGNVFRNDENDATHSFQFSQLDFFYVGKDININNLIWTIKAFLRFIFERDLNIRFRPSYFQFTEPSFEVDIECQNCLGKGCNICKMTGFIEVLGCGMLHPNVMKMADKKHLQGFAAGIGLERIAMLKWKISDIRYFFNSNEKNLHQFQIDWNLIKEWKDVN